MNGTQDPSFGTDRPRVLVVEGDHDLRQALVEELHRLLAAGTEVVAVDSAEAALTELRSTAAGGRQVAVAFVEHVLPGMDGDDLAIAIHADPELDATRVVLITQATSLSQVDAALNRGAIHGMLNRPWSTEALRDQLRAQLATFLVERRDDLLGSYDGLIGSAERARARQRVAEQRGAGSPSSGDRHHILLSPQYDEHEVVDLLVAALDHALGHPPRLRVSAGTLLLAQGTDVGGIYVILDGEVELRRTTEAGTSIVQRDTTAPIVGLLSLATGRRSFLEARAITELRALPVTIGQLERAIATESDVGPLLTRTLVNELAGRLRDSEDFQVRIDALNEELAGERDHLAAALADLELAQTRLIDQAQMATLGELAAGIAHELNNPAAALVRASEHVGTDIDRLIVDEALRRQVRAATETPPMRSAAVRAARRDLVDGLGDRALADRLLAAGVTDVDEARTLIADDHDLDRLAAAQQLGGELRNVRTAAERIAELVDSLRSYLRGGSEQPMHHDVDVAATVDDALGLLGHRLRDVTLEREIADVPNITGRPGRLQQLWTNLISNAIDATGPGGTIGVRVARVDDATVEVRITDDGPGIDPEVRTQLFRPRFTTKHGRVTFGSGLGLTIAKQIVDDHGGTIDLRSAEGVTTALVQLPVGGPGTALVVP